MTAAEVPSAAWADAALATTLLAIAPSLLGGMLVRSGPSPQRDAIAGRLRALCPPAAPFVRLPVHITEDRLIGGLSLAATLRAGRTIAEQGVLAKADGGIVIVAMAERIEPHVTSTLCAALDRGELTLERDGISAAVACRVGLLALDEGIDDEHVSPALRDRLALQVDLTGLDPRAALDDAPALATIEAARSNLDRVSVDDSVVGALCGAASALGVASLRAPLLATAVARVHAALHAREHVEESDVVVAARLVLAPRATRLPAPPEQDEPEPEPETAPPDPGSPDDHEPPPDPASAPPPPLDDIVLEAAKSGIPAGLLDLLALGLEPRSSPRTAGRSGVMKRSSDGGRPAGTRAGLRGGNERLNVVETLRAAAPWQPIRRRDRPAAASARRIEIRKDDFRATQYKQRTETSVIFAVDASGSAALQRLAEAKGAVEQVLVDCYVRRDHVALVAFRGKEATLLLPPTRSLARVRRCLADLAGGGMTPLAAGIDAALSLALAARKSGKAPVIVMMTDGRGNVARDGREGGEPATEDALASARAVRTAGIRSLFLDTAPRPRPQAERLAAEMGARYLPLPYLDAAGISRQVQSLAGSAS